MGFLRRNSNGSTGYHFLRKSGPIVKKERENSNSSLTIKKEMAEENNTDETEMMEEDNKEDVNKDQNNQDEDDNEDDQIDESRELPLMFGGLVEGLQSNSWTMASFLEDKKNKSSPSKTHIYFLK